MALDPKQFNTTSINASQIGLNIRQVLTAAINSADAEKSIINHLSLSKGTLIAGKQEFPLRVYKKVFVIGVGKAAMPMAEGVWEILGSHIASGILITKYGHTGSNKYRLGKQFRILEASHPIPDRHNLVASKQIIALSQTITRDDLVICLLSGGGSALLVKPTKGISLEDLQATTSLLLSSGAAIDELNSVRKHLDELKGGGLASYLFPATVIALILSDVVGDRLDVIASGPTVPDPTTYRDAWAVLEKYKIVDRVPTNVRTHLSKGRAVKIPETPKPGNGTFDNTYNFLVGSNAIIVDAAIQAAVASGFQAVNLSTTLQGEASLVGAELAAKAKAIAQSGSYFMQPVCLIVGGETTVTLRGSGLGGRNQELALGAVIGLSGEQPIMLISLATDGGDGPTDAAGAVATNHTYSRGLSLGMDPTQYLASNDSYHYFETLGDLIKTGPTLTNVNDLVFVFIG